MTTAAATDLVARSADPERVRRALERLVEVHPGLPDELDARTSAAEALVAVLAASRSLGRLLLEDPGALEMLHPAVSPAPPPTGSVDQIVTWKRRELLRIAARDLAGAAPVEEVTAALASMATVVLDHAHELAMEHLAADDAIAVIGMGKLGGAELNYASDVDVTLVGRGDPDRLARAGRSLLDHAGRSFRVDVDLRPEGRDGPLVRTLASYAAYWDRWAQPWERQALLKAVPVSGDRALGQAWAAAAGLVVWDAPFGVDELRHVRSLKVRAEAEARRRGGADRDVKRGPGGIRDVEFSAQLLQLVHGHVDGSLRVPGTLAALTQLRQGGYVDPDDAEVLADSYRFLRRVEHVLQLDDERQTHSVPADRARRRRVARALGFRGTPAAGPTEAFDDELARHRARVRTVHERVWFRPLLASLSGSGPLGELATAQRLEAFGFADVERTRQAVAELTRGLTRSSRMMQQLLPLLLDWLSASPDPDLGLLGLRRLASGEQRSTALATAFRDSPEVARHLALLLGTSRHLGDVLVANPDLIERLPDPDRLRTKPWDDLVTSGLSAISWRTDLHDRQRALQRWKQRHLLGVAARDVFGHAGVEQVGADLTRLAEVTLEGGLRTLDPQVPFAVVAFGRFGGAELGYASDLDLAFVHEGADAEEAERVAGGLLRFVGGDTPAERIWAVDADLRPEGRSGPLARSLDGWDGYLDRWASTWERQAYLRVRCVAGDATIGHRLVERIRAAVWAVPLTIEEEREVRRMKVRIERERIAPGEDAEFHLKLGRGSLADIEFTVQLLQLRHGVAEASTMAALGAARGGRAPARRRGRGARGGLPVLRGHAEPHLPRGRSGRLPAHPARAHRARRALAGSHGPRAPGGLPTGHAARAARGRAALLRPDLIGAGPEWVRRARGLGGRGIEVPLHPQVKVLLDGLAQVEGPAMTEVTPVEARAMFKNLTAFDQPEEVAAVADRVVPGAVEVPVRVYTPEGAEGGSAPLLLWIHGGGWVIGDLDTADATARALANRAGAVVVSVDYRLAPEHPAPAALDDTLAALTWAVEHADELGVDAGRVAVGGDSAGGNLAAALCLRVRDDGGPAIAFQLLVYPVADCTLTHPSMDENAEGYFLTKATMAWFVDHYLDSTDPKDPSVSPLYADSLAGLPPALVLTAEFDPLRDEGEAYAAALRDAGVPVEAVRYDGQIHGFVGLAALLEDGQHALDRSGAAVRAALG